MDILRAFIAIEMPLLVAEAVRKIQAELKHDGLYLRWVRPENVHLTLRFLGDISISNVPAIQEAMKRSALHREPFFLRISGLGVFPGLKHPKVMWLGLKGQTDQLEALYRNLSTCLAEQGIPLEQRPFKGHLTIGRVKGALDSEALKAALLRRASFQTDDFPAESIRLFKSDLRPQGAVYTPLMQIKMGKQKKEPAIKRQNNREA